MMPDIQLESPERSNRPLVFEDDGEFEQQYKTNVADLVRSVKKRYEPPTLLKVSQFADKEIVVTTGPLAGTHWQTDFAPYQRGIMDIFHETGIEIAVVMGSSQWGKTAILVNVCAYHIAHDPCPILVVEPTVDPMAKDFARNRLDPTINASPILLDAVSKKRAKDASNTTLQKSFRGGSLSIGGANSAASLAARSIRLLLGDEIDRWPHELPGEGNTLAIALKRTTAYRRRRRIMLFSSPTLEGASIHLWFERGDQRRYHVPCPSCACMHPFMWAQVRWKNDDPSTARIHCPACDHPISDAERVAILARGEWRAEKPERRDRRVASFHLWEAYSPLSSLPEIVAGFLNAREKQKQGDRSELHTWTNTTLGEPLEPDQGEGVEPSSLLLRREQYGADIDLPAGVCCLTMGVDTQDDRLELLVIGWGPGEESWLIDRHTLPGDTSLIEPWEMLDEVLDNQYRHANGLTLSVQSTCIDSAGHRTTMVYDYAGKNAARRVFAIIGRDGQRPIVSSPSPRKWGRNKRKVPLYTIGVDPAKSMVVSRLGVIDRGPGFVHFPHADWADEELCAQLTSERLVTKFVKGVPSTLWKKMRPRNEALDCAVYALCALRLLNPNLHDLARRMAEAAGAPQPPTDVPPPTRRPWINRPRGGWLRGNR